MTLNAEQFVGAWSLIEWRIEYSDGRITHPFGDNATGQLIYSTDGNVSATVSAAKRRFFDQGNIRQATDGQRSAAFDSYFHYAGTWHVDADTVVHRIEFALNPNMVGTTQIRKAHFDGANKLVLSANEELGRESTRHHVLAWKRRDT